MEGETSGMNGVGEAAMTQSMMATPSPSLVEDAAPPDLMTSSMHSLSDATSKKGMVKRPQGHRNDTSQQWFLFSDENEGRTDMSVSAKDREEKVRRLRESQEEERKKKLEELKAHALNSQKFREQQENERRRHIEELRSKDQERRCQVEERRKEIEKAENERREALLLRNKEREERINSQRKNSRSHIDFAFGSSAPRLLEPRIDSGYWGSRSPGDRSSAEREIDLRNKRTVSAQGLDRSTEGDEDGLVGGFQSTAHRRRTDLVPTIVMPRGEWSGSRSATPSKMRSPGRAVSMSRIDSLSLPRRPLLHAHGGHGGHAGQTSPSKSVSMSHLPAGRSRTKTDPRRPPLSLLTNQNGAPKMRPRSKTAGAPVKGRNSGISRENTSTASRPGSAMSGGSGPPRPVRLRSAPSRRPRPTSIATTGMSGGVTNNGMTASMYEERQRPQAHVPRQKSLGSGTPKLDRMKRARSVTSEAGADDDARSTTSSVGPAAAAKTPARKTPAQVKAEAAARKLKGSSRSNSFFHPRSPQPKSNLGPKSKSLIKMKHKATKSEGGAKSEPSTPKSEASTPKSTKSEPSTPRTIKSEPITPRRPKREPSASKTTKDEDRKHPTPEVHKAKTPKPDRKAAPSEKTPKLDRKNVKAEPSVPKTPRQSKKSDHKPTTPKKSPSKTSSRAGSVENDEKVKTEEKIIVEVESSKISEKETAKEDIIINLETNIDQENQENIIKPKENVEETETDEEKLVPTGTENVKATQAAPSTPKTSLGQKDAAVKKSANSKSPSPSLSTENVTKDQENRLTTPDIIKNNHKEVESKEEKETTPEMDGEKEQKNIISSEEEAKARIALKRKEMKEKKEREEELERQRQLEIERQEEERRLKEEEEERKMMEEADRMAVDARKAEEERIQKAIEEAEQEKKRQEEEEERLKIEKEEIERKTKEEAEKREAELQEKLKKEEEERLARKKRIEEIMARTRGKGATPNTTPKKEVEPQGSPASQPSSLDTNVDPTKPDLLGDINHDNVAAENAKNIEVSASVGNGQNGFDEGSKNGEAEVEKGTLDSLSKADRANDDFITKPVIHGMDLENSKPRSPSPHSDAEDAKKCGPAVTEGSQFDQLIDLGAMADTNKAEMPDHQPILAFEDSIPSPRQQQNTAELLS